MKIVIGLAIIYMFFVIFVYLIQRSLIYIPDTRRPLLKEWGMEDMQEVVLTTSDKLSLLSWYKPACHAQPTLLYFQGNAGNIGLRGNLIRPYLEKGYGVFLLGYRGYGGNPGTPTEKGLYQDMMAAWNFLQGQGIPNECIVLLGESLGTGLAIELASQHKVGAVVLLSPYTSMTDLAIHHYPFLPVKFMLKDHFDSLTKISAVKAPILMLSSEQDSIVPIKFSSRLFNSAHEPKVSIVYHDIDHNSLPQRAVEKVVEFLTKHQICKEKVAHENKTC